MKMNLQRISFALLMCVLLSGVVMADVKSKNVTFKQDVRVGDTLIKKGDYRVAFDVETNELTIISGNKVVARTTARLEERKSASRYTPVYVTLNGDAGASVLSSVNMGGKYAVLGTDNAATKKAANSDSSTAATDQH